jgi:hypothetical protein
MAYYELLVMIKEWGNEAIVLSVCNVKTDSSTEKIIVLHVLISACLDSRREKKRFWTE